jgi:hypothetical protein
MEVTIEGPALLDLIAERGGHDSLRSRRRRESFRREIGRRIVARFNAAIEQEMLYGSAVMETSGIVPKGIFHE